MTSIPNAPEFYIFMGDSHLYRTARGWPFFEAIGEATQGGVIVHLQPEKVDVKAMFLGQTIVFAALDLGSTATVVDALRESTTALTIVDVTFPIASDGSIFTLPDSDGDAVAYWSDPEHLTAGMALIRAADAVTTPRGDWARDLAAFNSNVFVLPDTGLDADADEDEWEYSQDWVNQFMGVINAGRSAKGRRIADERLARSVAENLVFDSFEQAAEAKALAPELIVRFGGTEGEAVLAALRCALGTPAPL